MFKKFNLVLLLLFSIVSFSQNSFTLKGKVIEEATKLPLEATTVYVSLSKDSTLVDYTITDRNGNFSLNLKKIKVPFYLKVSMVGFEDHKVNLENLSKDKDFGVISLKEQAKMLGEVIVKADAPPVRLKKDTLEFNAASFKVRPDSNVETLLKQLPGVEIDSEGKITVNGKEVNQILVNGKPFFDKDGKIALQNLPSDIINKVQISDTKTKKEELSGQASSSNNASINLTIDEDKNKGFFGKFMAGYGTDERYESSALVNYFKNKRKLSILASSNNINSTGFSMDEIFDNMGGGRSRNFYYADNGSFGMNGMRFGAGNGITQSDMVGVNYSDEWFKNFETNTSYFYSDQHSKNNNRTKQVVFLPDGDFVTESSNSSKVDNFGNNLNFEFEYKVDSTSSIVYIPKFNTSKGRNSVESQQSSKDEIGDLLNVNNSASYDEADLKGLKQELYYNKSFKKKGRFLNFTINTENTNNDSYSSLQSTTVFYQDATPDDVRNQIKKNKNLVDNYNFGIEYSEPIVDSLKVNLGVEYDWKKSVENRKAFDFDDVSQDYSIENASLTNYLSSDTKLVKPSAGISIDKKKFGLHLNAGTGIANFDTFSSYLDINTSLNKQYALPFARAQMNVQMGKSKRIWMSYDYEFSFPSANQVLPVLDLANPLSTFIGNPNLDLNKSHSFYFSFNNYDYQTRSGYSFYMGGDYYDSQIVSFSSYDDNRVRTTTYTNVQDTYSSWFGFNWSKTVKKEEHKLRYGFGMNSNFGLSKGFANLELYEAQSIRVTPRVYLVYDYGELLNINPSYNFTYNQNNYTNYTLDQTSNLVHRFNLQVTNYWPKNWAFGNDFGYTYNSNIADGFKKDFYLWNSSLAYSFYNKKFTVKVKVYDMLNQNQSVTRTISATGIRDEENTVLKRYAMFSLTYKIEKFAGKEKKGGRFMMH